MTEKPGDLLGFAEGVLQAFKHAMWTRDGASYEGVDMHIEEEGLEMFLRVLEVAVETMQDDRDALMAGFEDDPS